MGKPVFPMSVISLSAALICSAISSLACAQSSTGFTLLDFRSQADISFGNYRGWEGYLQNQPITLTYQFDEEFMDFLGPTGREHAIQAVLNALQTWSDATHGHLLFELSPWVAVPNDDDIADGGCWAQFEGPSCLQWEQMGFPTNDPDLFPGWGANIDFFTKPVGFTITSGDITYQMTSGILGFAVIYREGDFLKSADIYLNEAWTWTTSPAQANANSPTPAHPIQYACESAQSTSAGHLADTKPGDSNPHAAGLTPVFDVQTVVLHELGHALGLDHPNEAQAHGGAIIDPYTFEYLPGNNWNPAQVMHGDYNGVKRELKPPDIGGMAYLYIPALPGDLNANGQLDSGDAFDAIQSIGGDATPSPYAVNIMDFVERDGVISDLEVATVVQWAFDESVIVGSVPNWSPGGLESLPTALIVTPMFTPPVMVAGSPVTLTLCLSNPDQRNIRMWTIEAQYDPTLLANPRISDGVLFNGAIWITPEQEPGRIRFARVSIEDEENGSGGSVVNLTFDVLAVPETDPRKPTSSVLALTDARILVTDPVIHVFGDPQAAETLIVHALPVLSANLDINGDGKIGTEDWYAFLDAPIDLNGDSVTDTNDEKLFLSYMRQAEIADVTSDLAPASSASTPSD